MVRGDDQVFVVVAVTADRVTEVVRQSKPAARHHVTVVTARLPLPCHGFDRVDQSRGLLLALIRVAMSICPNVLVPLEFLRTSASGRIGSRIGQAPGTRVQRRFLEVGARLRDVRGRGLLNQRPLRNAVRFL